MSRQEDFKQASQSLEIQVISNPWTLFEKGCEHGYQYAVEHSDDVIRLMVRMAKKDIAFTEEEAVKFYHKEIEE